MFYTPACVDHTANESTKDILGFVKEAGDCSVSLRDHYELRIAILARKSYLFHLLAGSFTPGMPKQGPYPEGPDAITLP